nr:PREDICTED: zinc finger protein 469 [Paralichthys olivaceus]XP_019934817.1 PREDICTED: zinc finger protein 469 [Paralichthys olivaceus]
MAGETQRIHAVKELEAESKLQDEGTALEQQRDKTTKESSEHFSSTSTEARASSRGAKVEKLEKERDCPQQREAVIRPQQAGKIDFRSLQNRSKFATDRTWSSGKGSPQSPSGKGRSREKGKRSGKAERGNPQQLYRLSITNPRSNNPIGIAYPQQKVAPPKKLENSRGPLMGSYRFHVPSIPEREAELQQEELNYSRCFQEASSNLTSPSYTSQALVSSNATSSHPHPPLSQQQQQQSASMENSSTQPGSQLMLADFHLSGSNAWQSPERTFNGATYGVSSQKSTALSEANKANAFVPGPFQYGYNFLEESTSDSFSCDQNSQTQDFTDSSIGSVHVTHNSFSFTAGEGQNIAPNSAQFSNEQQSEDGSSYSHSPQSQYIQGVASSTQCPRNMSEDSASSDSSGSSSQQTEQGKTSLPESTDTNGQADSRDATITSGNKRSCHPKDTAANQRTFIQGTVHHARNISQQGPGSHMQFSSKTFNSPPVNNIHTGSMTFDKNVNNKVINRIPHSWEGPSKTYSPADQNSIQFSDMNDKFQFQEQPALDQRPNSSKTSRMPWQQIRPTMPNQKRVELTRQISNQKLAYIVPPSDWQDDSKSHKHSSLKNPGSFQNSRTSDGFSNQRQEIVKHNTVSTFKVEMSHAQVCESKNKAVYFGLNQSLPVASRNYSYPPLQVPPMGHMMVSPYESPLPSPVHNHASSSTCSSLSPASTSPVNISSEDSQMSKSAPPHTFYHQPQTKTQIQSDHLSSHNHQFHSDASRNLTYAPDQAKDDMMSYMQNSTHQKQAMDGNKGYMDSFGVEHHQPPPPYSAHQLLATSLATANLDQLDVLLTCKQCDQNFNNLASFFGHKQYCAQHMFAQNDLKDISKMEESRKFHAEPAKAVPSVSNISMTRCPSDLHLSLLGLNKNGELMSDSETKGDSKDDPMKLNLFSGPSNIPVPLPELEMEDAKLDSLITEALNGLAYQSENAEIDSSFIDAFADDELTTVKATSNKQCLKTKESLIIESKNKQATDDDRPFTQGKCFYDSDVESPETGKQYTENKLEKISLNLEQDEKINLKKEASHKNSRIVSREKTREQDSKVKEARKLCKREDENASAQRLLLSSKLSERCGGKSIQDGSALRGSTPSLVSTSPTLRAAMKESKRKSSGGGTWSKELIHKIVQQKNKLHKLHVKGTKNLQFSLVMERLTPTVQNPAFGEYDYVSDSEDECEPVKIASQGRLNQSSRCKYTYTKECKWRARSERDQAAWRHESKECFEVKKSEEVSLSPEKHSSHQRLRRRGSRSSTSSELSTSVSVSSESINSPKSTDRTDSDCEKKTDMKKKEFSYERSSPQKLCKESSTLALTFTKSVRKYNADKVALSEKRDSPPDSKKHHSNMDDANLVSSSQKAKDTMRNYEKSKSSHTKSKEKLVSHKKETSTAVSPDRDTLHRADSMSPKEEATQSTDNKQLQLDSHSPIINKDTDFNHDTYTQGKGEEGPKTTQPELSDCTTFEKQSDPVCTVKEAITLSNDLDTHKPASLCTSLMDEVCLSPAESQAPLIQKDTLHLMPYPLDQEQGLMKSPLSFDTSSMFGDLAGFDSGLYSDMPIQKEGFHSIESTSDKKEEFVSSFSPFLEQRDWNLIVSPVLPDEISQYKDNSEKSNEKKPDYNHVPLSLPEKIIDYSTNLNSCASEDELEIKRIVNELENQLQTTRLESPPLLAQDVPKQLQMSKFSPLRLSDESESDATGLDMRCTVQTMDEPVTRMPSEPFTEQGLQWSSPFQFELMGGHHSPHTPTNNEPRAHFTEKDNDAQIVIATASHIENSQLHHDGKSEERSAEKQAPLETKEDILEQKRYTENLMKSLEVISDSIFKKEPIISEHKELNVTSLTSQQHEEIKCQTADAVEREDHSEKKAITKKKNILSPPNINEREDDIEFILSESRSPLSASTDPTVDGNQPISSQPSAPSESNDGEGETKVTSVEDVAENRNLIESAHCSSVVTRSPREDSCGNSSAEKNMNHLSRNKSDALEHLTTVGYEAAEAVKGIIGQTGSHPSSPALPDTVTVLQESSSIFNHGEFSSSHAGELKVERSDDSVDSVEAARRDNLIRLPSSKLCSPAKICGGSPAADLSVEIVTTEQPCSPIVEDANTGSSTHCSPFQDAQSLEGQHNLLILSQADDLIDSVSCKAAPFHDSLKAEEALTFDTFQKQEEILHVQDIKEHLPIHFMASHQNSPCREDGEDSHCLFLNAAPSTSPLLSPSIQTPEQKLQLEEDSCQPQIKCNNRTVEKDSSPNRKSPSKKEDNQIVREGLNHKEQLNTTAEMEFSLISPPHLDLGITECKISSSETTSSTSTAEPAEVEREQDPMYEFKLSSLNYTSISDEPPHLNQYDYTPISPAGKPKDSTDMKQGDDCEPCDLSVNPALIFNKTETDMKLNPGTTSEINVSDKPLVLQQHIKFTCFSMGLPAETNSANSSAGNLKKDLVIRHDPAEPIEQLHILADVLREAESVNLDSHKASAEDSALLRKVISDGPPTPKPLIICENEEMPLPPDPAEKQPTIETGRCSIMHKVHKETTQKKTQSDAQQGKVLCEICFMCFRTVPGLKRHKAMKHLVRAEKHIGPQKTLNHQGTVLLYESSQTTEKEHKDDSQTCYPAKIDGLSETNSTLISKASETESAREEMETETSAVDEIGHQNALLPTRAKKNNKARKNKNSDPNIKPDPFSDEILNILKTDILQAISPEFKSAALQGHRKSPEEQVKINDRTVSGTEEFPVTSGSGFDNAPPPPTKDTNALTETAELNPVTHTVEMKCTSVTEVADGEVCADINEESAIKADEEIIRQCDESRETLCPLEEVCDQRGSDESLAQEILRKVAVEIKCEKNSVPLAELHPLSCLNSSPLSPPGLSSDLKALLDDDTTFSQLFPRDEEAKRKKCQRVYSKKNKRQKLLPDSDGTQDYPPSETLVQSKDQLVENQAEQIFTEDQTNQCEYETISIDDAIMLNMCHNSTLKADDVKQSDHKDVPENIKGPSNNLLNPLESTIDKTSIEWSGSTDFSMNPDSSTCKPEAPQAPCPAPFPAASYPVEPCVTENIQPFHSIDIQSINTTFQLPEVQFFDSNNDMSVSPNIANVGVESRDDEKCKKVTERRGRKRQDGGIKVKDKQYKCKVCFTWFLTLGELNFHKLSHNPSPPPTCYMCVQRKFSSREQLRDHLREKHAKNKTGIWTCGMCLKEISDVWMYNEHLREHATQFARRGQTQGSILDIPGCFMQETAVKNFITSIMQHRPSKAMRDSSKVSKEQEKAAAADRAVGDRKTSQGAEPKVHKTKSSSGVGGKQSTLTPLEVLHNTETSKSVEMHPNCKDPSRDCHHCGKQFPKPFKLQRHLVVHNLEKIFLCHKCPVTYQEAQSLKEHLKRAHEEVDELDSKHTTLYTCELCADVMHVIKKSFICSTCNYTFSKKEQFDRHMEKHLSGGNKIFKFRGVLRPVKASASREDECDSSASKKRRILSDSLQESSSDSGIASLSSVHLNQNSETQSSKPFTADDSTQTIANEYHSDTSNANVKTEDMAEDYSELLVELEKCIHMGSSKSATPKKEEIEPTPSPNPDKEGNGKSITEPCDVKEENESVCIRAETTSWSASKESSGVGEEIIKGKESSAEGDTAQLEEKNDLLPPSEESPVILRENQIISKTQAKHELAVDVTDQQRDDERWQQTSKTSNNDSRQQTLSHGAEQEGSCQTKDKAAKTIDSTKNSSTKAPESTPVLHSKVSLNTSVSNEDKESLRPQKKRKDMKSPHSLQRVSSPATQENFGVDSRPKKKFRPSKCSNPSLQRKTDGPSDYPVLSSMRDDAVSNKIVSKCKSANLGLQSKRSLLDSCTPKKADIVNLNPLNGDYKTKKGPLGRSSHPPISKVSSVPMNNSLNKSRPKMGVRSMESHSYRTAESQNHLLSQLFGQKLTSFKIPLRKDTSESMN